MSFASSSGVLRLYVASGSRRSTRVIDASASRVSRAITDLASAAARFSSSPIRTNIFWTCARYFSRIPLESSSVFV